jgi:hypothetical protein
MDSQSGEVDGLVFVTIFVEDEWRNKDRKD